MAGLCSNFWEDLNGREHPFLPALMLLLVGAEAWCLRGAEDKPTAKSQVVLCRKPLSQEGPTEQSLPELVLLITPSHPFSPQLDGCPCMAT